MAAGSQADPRLLRGMACQQRGDLIAAEFFYADLLRGEPDHADALQLLGAVRISQHRHEEALTLIDQALRKRPRHALALRNRAIALRALKRPDEALIALKRALKVEPEHAGGMLARAQLLLEVKRPVEALEAFERLLRSNPRHVAAMCGRAGMLAEEGRLDEAADLLTAALEIEPGHVESWWKRGTVRANQRRLADALADYEAALVLDPVNPEALYNKGVTLLTQRRFHEAIRCFNAARTGRDEDARALNNIGFALLQTGYVQDAIRAFEGALQKDPMLVSAVANKAEALRFLDRWDESVQLFEQLAQMPGAGDAWHDIHMVTLLMVANWRRFGSMEHHCLENIAHPEAPVMPLVLTGIRSSRQQQQQAARKFTRHLVGELPPPLAVPRVSSRGRLRVAYVSANFNPHPVAYALTRLLDDHDRDRLEIVGISMGAKMESAIGTRLRAAMHSVHDVQELSDRDAADLIRSLDIDIAVDLMGHSDSERPRIFSHRPAPVQVNFLGYPGTLGASFIDYIIADPYVIPPAHADAYDEKVAWLPSCYMPGDPWQAPLDRIPSRESLGLPAEGVVFGCFNTQHKILPHVFDLWARILDAVPGSVLWLRDGVPELRTNLGVEAARRGLDPARLVFAPRLSASAEHRARLPVMDLFLDTFPYNAHSTAREMLAAGVPLLTCEGDTFASRAAGSILHHAGLDDLIAADANDYVERAIAIGSNAALRESLRNRMRNQVPGSSLFDTRQFARDLESAYAFMHAASSQGRRPESFHVTRGAVAPAT